MKIRLVINVNLCWKRPCVKEGRGHFDWCSARVLAAISLKLSKCVFWSFCPTVLRN